MARFALIRRPAFGRYGNKVVAFFCAWEIAALIPGSPVPTISRAVELHPWFGWVLLVLLGHHWFLELEAAVVGVIGEPAFSDDLRFA